MSEVLSAKEGGKMNFDLYRQRLEEAQGDSQMLLELLDELIKKAREMFSEEKLAELAGEGKFELSYYETVRDTQDDPEILAAEIADFLTEIEKVSGGK